MTVYAAFYFQVNDKNTGLINPMNGTILVEIEWVYNHVILIDRFHAADLINARQYHQLKYVCRVLQENE